MNRKSIRIVGVCFVVLVAAFVSWRVIQFNQFREQVPSGSVLNSPSLTNSDSVLVNPEAQELDDTYVTDDQSPSTSESAERLEEQKLWNIRHGYHEDGWDKYHALTQVELEQFVPAGDVEAIQYLASKYHISDPATAITYYEDAAVVGSTYAAIAIADLWLLHDQEGGKLHMENERFTPALSALSYSIAAEIRGNAAGGRVKAQEILRNYKLNESDIQLACQGAKTKVAEWEKRRLSKGMENFDNSRTPINNGFVQGDFDVEICRDLDD